MKPQDLIVLLLHKFWGHKMIQIKNFIKNTILEPILFFKYRILGVRLGNNVKISRGAIIDTTHPKGIIIGDHVLIARGAVILSHDFVNQRKLTTKIGCNVFIGCNSIILPGVIIPDNCIIAAGAIVTKNFTGNSIIAGNPARLIRSEVKIGKYGLVEQIQK